MIFLELVLQNFGPYYGRHIVNLNPEIDSNFRPIILFGGMNGGGKTTLIDAIRLSLYGHRAQCSTRGNLSYSQFLLQSINNQTKPDEITSIELAFKHIRNNQNIEYRITRQWSKNQKDVKDKLKVTEDNSIDWVDNNINNTWDEYIESILPIGISNLFLFDGEEVKELAEQDTLTQSVIEAIKSLLGLELTEILSSDLDVLANRKRKAIATNSQLAKLEEIEAIIAKLNKEKQKAEKQLNTLSKDKKKADKHRDKVREKFKSEGSKIAKAKSELENKLETLKNSTSSINEEFQTLAAGFLPLALISPLLKQAEIQGVEELKCQQAKMALNIMQSRDRRLLNYLSKISLNPEKINKIEYFLEQENQELTQKASQQSLWLGIDSQTLNQFRNILNNQLPKKQEIVQEKLQEVQKIEENIQFTMDEIAVADSPEEYNKLEEEFNHATQESIKLEKSYLEAKKELEAINRQLIESKKELESYSKEAIDRQNDQHIINSIDKVKSKLKEFKHKLALKKISKLEKSVTQKFRYLLHKSDLVNRVEIDTNNFKISIYDSNTTEIPKHRLSAGEKQLLAIALLWGLAEVSDCNLPITIDTPLGRLDSSHRNNLIERYFPQASHQVILLSTDTEIEKTEIEKLRKQETIAREYLLKYDGKKSQTTIVPGYFW